MGGRELALLPCIPQKQVARDLASYASANAGWICGMRSEQIAEALGCRTRKESSGWSGLTAAVEYTELVGCHGNSIINPHEIRLSPDRMERYLTYF